MKKYVTLIAIFCGLMLTRGITETGPDYDRNWPQWRGPTATGVAPHGNPPVEWSEDQNIRWKSEIPGKGLATPIVWEGMVFVLTAIPTGEETANADEASDGEGRRRGIQPSQVLKFDVVAVNREDGKVVWQKTARKTLPHEGTHSTASWASSSAITDGEHVYAYFGSQGLYCYDMEGNLKWDVDLGDMTTRNSFGEGSSPALHGDKIVIVWDHEGPSFIVALDKNTGKELWRKDRDERTSWATPLIVEHEGKAQVITSATNRVRSYDLDTGELIWECGGMTVNAIPTPIYHNGLVYVTSGFRGSSLQAIRLAAARGDITGTGAVVWEHDRDTPYVPSPVLFDNHLYFLKVNTEIMSCFNATTGEEYYSETRLEGIQGVYASPVAAQDRVYFVGRNGAAVVVKHGSEPTVLATNSLDDGFDASPAIVGNELYLRGYKYLYCIASE